MAISALRSALGAVGNAEAVAPAEPGAPFRPTLGVGAADVARRELSLEDVRAIVRAEIDDRFAAAAQYELHGRGDEATRLRAEGDVLLGVLEER